MEGSAVAMKQRIMQELKEHKSHPSSYCLLKVREIFAAQTGRTVPSGNPPYGVFGSQMFIMCVQTKALDQDQLQQRSRGLQRGGGGAKVLGGRHHA